jgi:hypothetical protein
MVFGHVMSRHAWLTSGEGNTSKKLAVHVSIHRFDVVGLCF